MNTDSIGAGRIRRQLLWSIPLVVVHVGIVVIAAVAAVVLSRRGQLAVMRHVDVLAGALGVVGSGTLLNLAFGAMFASNLCSFLASLPGLVGVAPALNVAHVVLTYVALPLAVAAAWQALRGQRRDG